MKKYATRDREAGNIIEEFETLDEAKQAIAVYEEEDLRNDEYTEDFYEIAVLKDDIYVTWTPASAAQKKATAKYDSENTVKLQMKLNKKTDSDIINVLNRSGNKQGYIKSLIRQTNETQPVTRMKLTIVYKNGNRIEQLVNYFKMTEGKLCFTLDEQAHPIYQEPVKVPIENIESFELEKVEMIGWQ